MQKQIPRSTAIHDDVIKWKHFPRDRPFVRGIHRPVTRSFDVFFDLRLNKWLSKQPWATWLAAWWQLNCVKNYTTKFALNVSWCNSIIQIRSRMWPWLCLGMSKRQTVPGHQLQSTKCLIWPLKFPKTFSQITLVLSKSDKLPTSLAVKITYWWRHGMEKLSYYWPFVRGIHRWTMDSPHKGPIMHSVDVFLAE